MARFTGFDLFLLAACGIGYAYYANSGGASATGDTVVIDGFAFPESLKMAGVAQQVTGGGTRIKYGVAKVYAAALYIDAAAAAGSLRSFAATEPPKTPKFFQTIVDGVFSKTLYLQFHRSVSAEAMVEALNEAMNKRLPPASVAKFAAAVYKAIPASIAKGDQLFFMCKSSSLMIGAGKAFASVTLREKGVCAALFDVYYGKAPVAPAAKEGAAAGFAKRFYLKK